MRRIACVALPEIRVELCAAEPRAEGRPVAVVVARPGGAVRSERDVLGNTRLDVVCPRASALGVRPGQTVAAARARCGQLRVCVVAEGAVHAALARLAEASLAFGPAAGFDVAQDVVWIDVTGCAHLFGDEGKLARSLEARVRQLGHACRVAVADGPRLAAAAARFSHGSGPALVAAGQGAEAMRALPVAALALGDEATAWLRDLGLHRCGDLQRLPRRSLGVRLGARVHDVMDLLAGDDRAPLSPWRPPEIPEERVELEWGAASTEALAFVCKTLCDRLAARLHGRAMAAARLEIVMSLDRGLLAPGATAESRLQIVLPVALGRAGDLLAVVRSRLEGVALAAPALAVTLRATELSRASARTLDLLEPEPAATRALPRLMAELSAELGATHVGVLALADTWAPDERTRLLPVGSAAATRPERGRATSLVTSALEPTRLVAPRPAGGPVAIVRLLARFEDVEWWRRAPLRRDLVAAWVGGKREGALGWVELAGGEATVLGWMD